MADEATQSDDLAEVQFRRRSTTIDPLALKDEFVRLSADLATWNARLAIAMENYLEADLEFDQMEARLSIEWRETLAATEKKATEAAVKERVLTDARYTTARLSRIDAEVERAKARGTVDAILAKKEMLISLGASVRVEMQGDLRMREEQRHHGE